MSSKIKYKIIESIDETKIDCKLPLVNKDDPSIHYGNLCPHTKDAICFLKQINDSGKCFDSDHLFIANDSTFTFSKNNILDHIYITGFSDVTADNHTTLKHVILHNANILPLGIEDCTITNSCIENVTIKHSNDFEHLKIDNSIVANIFCLKGQNSILNSIILNTFGKMSIIDSDIIDSKVQTNNPMGNVDKKSNAKLESNSIISHSKIDHVITIYTDFKIKNNTQFKYHEVGIRIKKSQLSGFLVWAPLNIKNTILKVSPIHIKNDYNATIVQPDPIWNNKDINKQPIPNYRNLYEVHNGTITPKALYITGIKLELDIDQDSNSINKSILKQYKNNEWQNKRIIPYAFLSHIISAGSSITDKNNIACLINFCDARRVL